MLRSALLTALSFVSVHAFAQTGMEGQMRMAAPAAPRHGPSVSMIYTNLSDYSFKTTSSNGVSSNQNGSTHMGMAGARMSYIFGNSSAATFDIGASMQTRLNKSESAETMSLAVLDANLMLRTMSGVHLYLGPSVSKFILDVPNADYMPSLGGQIGIGYQDGAMSLRAGYSHHGIRRENDLSTFEGHYGGFSTQVGYVF